MNSVNTVENLFVGVEENTILYLTKDNINIMVKMKNDEGNLYRFFNVNESGKLLMESIDGSRTVLDFIKDFCKTNNLEYEKNKGWIMKFVIEMMQRKALKVSETPIENGKIINEGSSECISPMHATIEITEKCNLRCKHCYLCADIHKTAMITYEQFLSLVNTLVENNVVNIEITGGEIFMHPRILDILKVCYKNFAMVGVLTNGTVMTDEVLELITEHKDRTVVNISIDSIDSEIHDDFRGMKGAWKASCNTIERLAKRGVKVRMASSISKDNMWTLDKLADLAISLGAAVFSFNFIEEFGRGSDFGSSSEYVETKKYEDYIAKVIKDYKDIIPIIKEEDRSKKIKSGNCGSGTRSIVIGADGEIRPCPLSPKLNFIGNLFNEKFEDIFSKPAVKRLSEIPAPDIANGCDPNCKHLRSCYGCYIKGLEKNRVENTECPWITENHLEDVLELFKEQNR